MGIPVLIMGESGSGKSTSLRNFNENELLIYNVASKPLPFRKKFKTANNPSIAQIANSLLKGGSKSYAIDDSQYLMAFNLMDKAKEIGYGKFTDIAKEFTDLVRTVNSVLPKDVIVYFLNHVETTEQGKVKAKTSGKMIDNQITLEGLFSIVLLTQIKDSQYYFETQSDGMTTAKSPMEMFESNLIENDLKFVDETIRNYWNLGGNENE